LAIAIRTVANTSSWKDGNKIIAKITLKSPLFEAFVKGLDQSTGLFIIKARNRPAAGGAIFMPLLYMR